ncbi:CLAVATA3/ESR-RELATED 9 [Euphorbia peplus]|nr:CLAVATA3/ESR-RELATED 9 [Euphorbia peplus]
MHRHLLFLLPLLLLMFSVATSTPNPTHNSLDHKTTGAFSRNHRRHFYRQPPPPPFSCGSFPKKIRSPSFCIHFHRMRLKPSTSSTSTTTSSSPPGEIDPRYGVEKRLVPSGPNPLHN